MSDRMFEFEFECRFKFSQIFIVFISTSNSDRYIHIQNLHTMTDQNPLHMDNASSEDHPSPHQDPLTEPLFTDVNLGEDSGQLGPDPEPDPVKEKLLKGLKEKHR